MTRTEVREKKGLTRNELAYISGVSTTTIRMIELGNERVVMKKIIAVADALDVPLVRYIGMEPTWQRLAVVG